MLMIEYCFRFQVYNVRCYYCRDVHIVLCTIF